MSGSKSSPPSEVPAIGPSHLDEPLSLTVHSMPHLGSDAVHQSGNTRSAKLKLLFLLLVSLAPVLVSYFTYYVVRPEGRRNHGELIEPQRDMPALVGQDVRGQALPLHQLKDQWLLISVANIACDESCEKHLYLSRQLRESLGKDKDRLDWVWIPTGEGEVPARLLAGLTGAQVVRLAESDIGAWLQPARGHKLADHLYVVDPMGNWMMRFPANAEPAKVRKDLERLMRGSASWDLAGRP